MNISIPGAKLLQNIPYELFWDKIKKIGTPIIETLTENSIYAKVTFLYRANSPVSNVVLATYGLCSYDPRYDQLKNIPQTDIYFKTYLLPKQTRTIYCFSPNDSIQSLAEADLYNSDLSSVAQNWQPDCFNEKQYILPGWLVLGDAEKVFSLLELPDTPDNSVWIKKQKGIAEGKIITASVESTFINSSRVVHTYVSNYRVTKDYQYPLLIFFDGNAYLEYTSAATILDNLVVSKTIPPVVAIFIANPSPNAVTRWHDLSCNEDYKNFVAKELIPWAQITFNTSKDPKDNIIIGASLGGLSALYTGLQHSDSVGNVISQSGAFWWRPQTDIEDGWLMRAISQTPKKNLKVYLDVGLLETALTFNNGASILSGNRHMRDVLVAKGYDISYVEYAGGHDYICWQNTLPGALMKFFMTANL